MAPTTPGSSSSSSGGGTSAVDIITYVGIPLAVLGVVPTLYTCFKSLITMRDVRKALLQNHVSAITRSSLLSGIVEVEMQRKSLCPLDRDDPSYFQLGWRASRLRGGSWTQLNWRELAIGVKSYRLQYHDELCQPQAEVEFEKLVAFLLDLGAIPDPQGWEDLRSSGLWTPAGTKLMVSAETGDAILYVTTSEDSDGILSLGLFWRADWAMRRVEDLPPYWMRLTAPVDMDGIGQGLAKDGEADDEGHDGDDDDDDDDCYGRESRSRGDDKVEATRSDTDETLREDNAHSQRAGTHLSPEDAQRVSFRAPHGHKRTSSRTTARSSVSTISFQASKTSAIRIRLGPSGLSEASYEDLLSKKIKLPHLIQPSHHPHGLSSASSSSPSSSSPSSSASMWFASAATAFSSSDQGSLWAYTIPAGVVSLSVRDSVPGGVLVLLGLVAEDAVPAFRAPHDAKLAEHEAWVAQQKRMQRQMEQLRMTPEERARAFHKQAQDEHYERIEAARRREVEAERRREQDLREGLASPRVGVGVVAKACVSWLAREANVPEAAQLADVVGRILWEMVRDVRFAEDLSRMLDAWKEWSEAGGMTRSHFEAVKSNMLCFAYAACVLCLIRDTAGSTAGSVVNDLQECLRMWRKVRLG
ncbi:uncharacterized protein PV09_07812 [Verruconis gallopava]|uniref:Uncharacterized protein n=1 Tax=Verruconis gallopava TaxID=253628 RepID=A0A0D2A2M9_9PEZI|nr:uncharacterized protein PV09_07812 [Verruconis gallopava]KIW00615.1 hypothetical protein PV09_07812 [Verruconis gallopava]